MKPSTAAAYIGTCPACGQPATVTTDRKFPAGTPRAVRIRCKCGTMVSLSRVEITYHREPDDTFIREAQTVDGVRIVEVRRR